MTITITAGNDQATDFLAYLDEFDATFTAFGRGVFSHGISGDYAAGESEIGEEADLGSRAFIMGDNVQYSLSTHTLSGTISDVVFGYGATATDAGDDILALDLAQLDFSIQFDPEITDEDTVNDVIYSMLGYVDEGEGRTDALVALLGHDDIVFQGNDGDDSFSGYGQDDQLTGKGGLDTLLGKGGDDTLKGNAGKDVLKGGDGNDLLKGGEQGDQLLGGKGADTVEGGKGKDDIVGGTGKDLLSGGKGADTLDGGKGKDTLEGGGGADDFVFSGEFGKDTILDFVAGSDQIDLSGLSGEATSLQDFLDASTESGGDLTYDMGMDGANVIILTGVSAADLSEGDFIF